MIGEFRFSVIIPVCHGGRFLLKALRSLGEIEYPKASFEVLVAGNPPDRKSRDIVEAASRLAGPTVKYVETIHKNRSAMLNKAIAEARGNILIFADDDCIFLPDWLNQIETVLACESNIGVIGGQDIQAENGSSFHLALDYIFNSFLGTGGLRHDTFRLVGKYYPKLWNMTVYRQVADQVARKTSNKIPQIFNEALAVHEDVELVDRIEKLGKRVVYAPDVKVLHSRDTTLLAFVKRSFNMARTARSIGVHRLPHIVLSIFTLVLLALLVSSVVSDPLRLLLLVMLTCYVFFLLYDAFRALRRKERFAVFVYVPVLLISLHLARGVGFLFPWHFGKEKG